MRAIVEFEWRRTGQQVARRGRSKRKRGFDLRRRRASRAKVVRSVTRTTETGIRGVHGGDPAGTSKAMCLIY